MSPRSERLVVYVVPLHLCKHLAERLVVELDRRKLWLEGVIVREAEAAEPPVREADQWKGSGGGA